MPATAFLTEQAGLQHQATGEQAVAVVQQQVQITATAVGQQQRTLLQGLEQGLPLQPLLLCMDLAQGQGHAMHAAIHPGPLPTEQPQVLDPFHQFTAGDAVHQHPIAGLGAA